MRTTATPLVAAGERHDLVLADNVVEGEWPCVRADEFLDLEAIEARVAVADAPIP